MKTSAYAFCAFVFFCSYISIGQTNRVLVKIEWPNQVYEHKVEVYYPAIIYMVSIQTENNKSIDKKVIIN